MIHSGIKTYKEQSFAHLRGLDVTSRSPSSASLAGVGRIGAR